MRRSAIIPSVLCMAIAACFAVASAASPGAGPPEPAAAPSAPGVPAGPAAPAPVPSSPAPTASAAALPGDAAPPAAGAAAPTATDAAPTASGTATPPAAPADLVPLLAKIKDIDPLVRAAAATALGEAAHGGSRDPRIVAALTAALRDAMAGVRTAAIAALGATGDRHAAPPLLSLARQADAKTRADIARALMRLGPAPDDPTNQLMLANLEKPMPEAGIDKKSIKDALLALSNAASVAIQPSGPVLEKAGLDPTVPISFKPKDLPVVVALWEVLWSVRKTRDIGCMIKNGTVIVSTTADLDSLAGAAAGGSADTSVADQVARERLKTKVPSVKYQGVGLDEALAHFSRTIGLRFQYNWKAIVEADISRADPVLVMIEEPLTVESAIQQILDGQVGSKGKLGFIVKDGAVLISTKADLAAISPPPAPAAATPTKGKATRTR